MKSLKSCERGELKSKIPLQKDEHMDGQTDNAKSRVAFATEKLLLKEMYCDPEMQGYEVMMLLLLVMSLKCHTSHVCTGLVLSLLSQTLPSLDPMTTQMGMEISDKYPNI